MNKLLLIASVLPASLFAQITIEENSFPDVYNEVYMSTIVDPNLDFTTTGANQTWDFSACQSDTQRTIRYAPMSEAGMLSNLLFGGFAATEYRASYFYPATDLPLSDLPPVLPFTIDGISQFARSTPEAITLVGYEFVIGGQQLGVKSDTIEVPYEFPLNFGNNWESRGYTNLDMNPIYDAKLRQHRHRVSEVDGWGTVITPFGSFEALRIHHMVEETDSIYMDFLGTGTPMWIGLPLPTTHEYEWRAWGENEAVMRIRTTDLGGTQQATAAEYRDNYLKVAEKEELFAVYPNPASQVLIVKATNALSGFAVTDQSGKLVKQFNLSNVAGVVELDIADLAAGTYILSVDTVVGPQTRLFSKQ